MSSGLECHIIKDVKSGKWFYLLQNYDCPVGAWDWREYASLYGPFDTEEAAKKHLGDNHANPGGWSLYETPDIATVPRERAIDPKEWRTIDYSQFLRGMGGEWP